MTDAHAASTEDAPREEFRTHDGRCIVAEDRLRIFSGERGALGTLREALTDEEIPPSRRAGVALFPIALLVGAVLAVRTLPAWLSGAAAGLLIAWLAWTRLRGATPEREVVIPFDTVESVEPEYGLPLVTRPRFVIRHRSEGGVKQRYVLTPSRLYGFGAYERGTELFATRGLGEQSPADDSEG